MSVSFYGGAAGAVVIGEQGWVDDTRGWVAADPAGDLRQINAAQVTSVLCTMADPQVNADFIAMFETWDGVHEPHRRRLGHPDHDQCPL